MATEDTTTITKPARTRRTKDFGKGKKRDIKRNLSPDLIPLKDETWLVQPFAVTMMRHDYSLIQIRILIAIVEYMQTKLRKMINDAKREPTIFADSELDNDGRLEIKTMFKSLDVDPNHYPELRQSLKTLVSIPVEIPYRTSDGRNYLKVTNLCDVYIPEDNSYEKYAVLKIDRQVAERLVSIDYGWHKLGKQIVYACKNRYTQRIYMFIGSWARKGGTVINTLEFRKMLRLENNYKKFSDFTRRVLDPAKKELRALADNGFCDCYFDYEKQYVHGQRGGEPDNLVFHIYRPQNALGEPQRDVSELQRLNFENMLSRYFDLKADMAKKLGERLSPDNYQDALAKIMDVRNRIGTIRDRAAYAYRTFDNFFNGATPSENNSQQA